MRLSQILRNIDKAQLTPYDRNYFKNLIDRSTPLSMMFWMTKERTLTLRGIQRNIQNSNMKMIKDTNNYLSTQFLQYGAELHAAYFTCLVGGKCQLSGSKKWLSGSEPKKLAKILPIHKVSVDTLDFTNTIVNYDGIKNIEKCLSLKTLIMQNCPFIDDWSVSRIASTFADTLETLDLSKAKNITDNGLMTLWKLRKLKRLILNDVGSCKNIEYVCLLLEEYSPELQIEGVDYKSEQAIENVKLKIDNEIKQYEEKLDKLEDKQKTYANLLVERSFLNKN